MIRFTTPANTEVWIRADMVSSVLQWSGGVTKITLGGQIQLVRETVQEVLDKLREKQP
jgi:hypothetical protein